WDVGHQAYGHKILTGRRDKFDTLRTLDGLSGFPNPKESEYDSFVAGHASNSISVALGMAVAAQLDNEERNVVAVIGDASISGGLAFEGLNNAASKNSNIIIVLNDNDMAIDENVGALSKYLTRLTTSKSYNDFRYKTYQFFVKHKIINEKGRGSILRFNNSLKSFLSSQQNIFEGLNIRYFGPFDGHDVVSLVEMFTNIKDMKGPRIVHLHTRKGKGYHVAEIDPTTWHAPGKFNPETGERIKSAQKEGTVKYQDVFGKTLVELAEKNEKIVGITAAMPSGCSMTFMQESFPKRTFDVGISEGHAVTFSAGMAKDGLVPYCCIYSTFLQRAYDNIIHDVALQKLPVVLCLDRAGLVGEDGATHHGVFDLAYLRPIPGIKIASPIDEHWLRNLLYTAQLNNNGPIAIRYPRGSGNRTDWHNEMKEVETGKGQILKRGDKVAVLTLGPIGQIVANAINSLGTVGDGVGHYDMVWLKPLDEDI
ncbi:MAG: 1-deoxy-D-xylulose-5-phosphate synthase, partial [Bacteroidaceae bacterium]|nr:1-deoxy-D-xylulose-5-phosphate synthase [Bacteroidaceae bacterium]